MNVNFSLKEMSRWRNKKLSGNSSTFPAFSDKQQLEVIIHIVFFLLFVAGAICLIRFFCNSFLIVFTSTKLCASHQKIKKSLVLCFKMFSNCQKILLFLVFSLLQGPLSGSGDSVIVINKKQSF